MKKYYLLFIAFILSLTSFSQAQNIQANEVKSVLKKVADWQLEHFKDNFSRKKPHHIAHWTNGALYVGMHKWAEMADDNSYFEWLKDIADQQQWKLHKRQYHADDHTIGQLYCNLFKKYKDSSMIEPTVKQFDFIQYHPAQSSLDWRTMYHQDRWNWCDALFMSPPVWAQLYNITGDKRYLDFLVSEFQTSTEFLFDKKEGLYYRDQRFKTKLDHNTKIFWARGNGWVFAGLVNILNELEPETKEYKYFLNIYKKMAKKLIEIQTAEGHWAMSLLGAKFYPTPETSGTAFFTYGLAWGINQGILEANIYKPSVTKAWKALTSHVTEEGMLGYVQPIGAAPGEAWADKTEVYGTGAFLSAGSEIYKLTLKPNSI